MQKTLAHMLNRGILASALLLTSCRSVDINSDQHSLKTVAQKEEAEIYLNLRIKEEQSSGKISFSLERITATDLNHAHLVNEHYPRNSTSYVLETYNADNTLMGQYALHTGLYVIAEDFSKPQPSGRIIELKESIITSTIPYHEGIKTIKINHGTKTTLPVDMEELTCNLEERVQTRRQEKIAELKRDYPHIESEWNLEQMGLQPLELYPISLIKLP